MVSTEVEALVHLATVGVTVSVIVLQLLYVFFFNKKK
jgi:hypothetical protein